MIRSNHIVWLLSLPINADFAEIKIEFSAGYDVVRDDKGQPQDPPNVQCPQLMKQAVLDTVAYWYQYRGQDITALPKVTQNKLKLFKTYCINSAG